MATATKVKHTTVEIERIREHPDNMRTRITGIERLAGSVRVEGIRKPLIVHQKFERADGKQDLELVDGHRRLAAAFRVGLARVPVELHPYMEPEEILLVMLADRDRQEHEVEAVSIAVRKLRERHAMSALQIAERMGTSIGQVQAWLNGQGNLPVADEIAPNTPSPAIPAPRNGAPVVGMNPRVIGRKGPRNPAPHISAAKLYEFVTAVRAGSMEPETLVDRCNALLKGWSPS